MTLDLKALRALCDQATPGPWQWYGNTKQCEIYLATTHSGRRFVMDFVRWGMGGAQPRFQVTVDGNEAGGGIMRSIRDLAEGDENAKGRLPLLGPLFEVDYRRQFVGVGHPDAEFIASARNALPAALAEIDALSARVTELEAEMDAFRSQTGALGSRLMYERDAALAECERMRAVYEAIRERLDALHTKMDGERDVPRALTWEAERIIEAIDAALSTTKEPQP
jgi:hypothetical protein